MFPPRTPTKAIKADQDINSLIQALSIKWNLQLPVRDASWSPSRNPVNSEEKQIYERVRWLYFKKKQALDYVLAEYEKQAETNWILKPQADPDVLPTRSIRPSTRQNTFLKKRNISEEDGAQLRKLLFDILRNVTDKVKSGVPYEGENVSRETKSLFPVHKAQKADEVFPVQPNKQGTSKEQPTSLRMLIGLLGVSNPSPLPVQYETSPVKKLPRQQPSIADWFRPEHPPPHPVLSKDNSLKEGQPSSDDYPIGEADLLDLVSTDAPSNPQKGHSGSRNDENRAPPEENREESKDNEPLFRIPHPVPAQRRGLKRSCPEAMVPSMSRNVSREKRSSGYSRSHSANEIGSGLPNDNYSLSGHQDGWRSSATSELTRSFSGTSMASMASSRTHLSSGLTTPFTSFNTDSLTTSFDSANESDDPTITSMTRRGLPSQSHATVRSTSEPPSSQNITENIDMAECLTEIESKELPNASTATVSGAIPRIHFMNAEDYLQHNLFQKSPFCKMSHFKLQELQLIFRSPFRDRRDTQRSLSAGL